MVHPVHISRAPKAAKLAAAPRLPAAQHDQLVANSRKLISQAFFGTMLKQMRNSPFKSKLFDGGRGGETFSSMLDQHLADRMSRGVGNKLVNSMVRHIEKANGKQTQRNQQPAATRKQPSPSSQSSRPAFRRAPSRSGLSTRFAPAPAPRQGNSYGSADFRA
jgi:Rod binding domain-containing protein